MNRFRYHFKTGEFLVEFPDRGVVEQYTTQQSLPDIELEANQYFSMRDNDGNVPAYADTIEGANWLILDHEEPVTAFHKETLQAKKFDDKALVTKEYTLSKPPHVYVEYDSDSDAWVNSLTKRREAKSLEIKAWRDAQESRSDLTVTVDGVVWNADPAARERVSNGLTSTYVQPFWTDANNVDQESYDLQAIWDEIVKQGSLIHQRKREMNLELDALTTYEEIDNYVIGWPEE